MIIDQPLIPIQPFPPDTKIRTAITGLAFCRVSKIIPEIYFLRHVDKHGLKMVIARRERGGGDPKIDTYVIPKGDTIRIENDDPVRPTSYVSVPYAGEYDLTKVINFKSLHNGNLRRRTLSEALTPLFLHDSSFSTLKLTEHPYQLIEHLGGVSTPHGKPARVGDILVGKIKASMNSTTTVTSRVFETGSLRLPGSDGGTEFIYDIRFSNICDPDERDDCDAEPDFKYYYSVFDDSVKPGRYFSMEDTSPDISDLAACNPILEEPPGS